MVGKVINLPIFDCTARHHAGRRRRPVNGATTGNGSNAYYHRAGYAAFYLSGYAINVTSGHPRTRSRAWSSGNVPVQRRRPLHLRLVPHGRLSATAIAGPPSGGGGFGAYAVVPAG